MPLAFCVSVLAPLLLFSLVIYVLELTAVFLLDCVILDIKDFILLLFASHMYLLLIYSFVLPFNTLFLKLGI